MMKKTESGKKRLAIITTHPIQYYAPWFRLLAQSPSVSPKIFYTWEQSVKGAQYDAGFGKVIDWDIPLLEGYEYTFVKNIAPDPGLHHFKGLVNPTLINELKEWKPDAVLVIGWNYHSHLKCMRSFHKKIPVLFRGDSTLLDEQPGLKKILRRNFLRWVYRHVDICLYVGKNNKDYFSRHGLRDDQLIFAPHAIDNDRFADTEGKYAIEAQQYRTSLGIGIDDTVILFAAKLQDKKDPLLLLQACKQVEDSKLHLIMAGDGPLQEQLKQEAAGNKQVHFLPFQNQSQMPVLYRIADVFCLPSKGPGETWGLAVNEAMACGKAVIVSDRCGCATDLVLNGQNGFIFKHGNSDELVKSISYFLMHANDSRKMGNKSLEIIRQWSFQAIVTAIENKVFSIK